MGANIDSSHLHTHTPILCVRVPSHRQDVNIPADLVEEIGRIYGYDRFPMTLLEDELPPQRRNVALEGEEKVRDILAGAGLDEVITYSMIDVRVEQRSVGAKHSSAVLLRRMAWHRMRKGWARWARVGMPRPYPTSPCSTR